MLAPKVRFSGMTTKQIAVLSALALVWGASFLFIRVLVDGGVGPVAVAAGRGTFGVLALVPIALFGRVTLPRDRRTLAGLFVLALLNMAVPWTLFAMAEQHVVSSLASVANSSTPLWTAIFALMLLRADPLNRMQTAGLLVGLAGIVVLSANGLSGFDRESLLGTALIGAATCCYGISAVAIRRWFGHITPVVLAGVQLGAAAIVLWPVALGTGALDGATFGWSEWGSIIALGVFGSGLAMVGYVWLIGQAGAVRASVVTYLIPPTGVFLGWLVLGERIGWNLVAGLGFVIAGVALVQGWPVHRLWRARDIREHAAASDDVATGQELPAEPGP
jgi:drug/metabolite transporter (DMT)-like permease